MISPANVEVPVLIIGAGPAGASLALLLSRYGIRVLAISRYKGTADSPRAHLQNQRAMEVMRDAGIEDRLVQISLPMSVIQHVSWIHSFTGEEYARIYSWGNRPERKGDYERASPCQAWELPQTSLEPVLVEESEKLGAEFRWDTEFVSQEVDGDRVHTTLRSRNLGSQPYTVTSQFLIGADGARSPVLSSLGIPIIGKQLDVAFNVHIKTDLAKYMQHRPGSLTWVLNPDSPEWPAVANFRMVKPWTEFVVGMMVELRPEDDLGVFKADLVNRLHGIIGDANLPAEEQVPLEILAVSQWTVNDQVAREYQRGPVMCIGDAVHRHPPVNALGSNTCISDAFNLAWKMAYVLNGKASPRILDSLTIERKPVGDRIVRRANEGMLAHRRMWNLLGLTKEARAKSTALLADSGTEGDNLRQEIRSTLEFMELEVHALGMNMNQMYLDPGSLTVIEEGDEAPNTSAVNMVLHELKSTYPGYHLPHAWIHKDARAPRISTLDLAGHGQFTLITGSGGYPWKEAAQAIKTKGKIEVAAYSVGYRQDYLDTYGDWARYRGVGEDGCVLVRPDHFIAWRCATLPQDPVSKLEGVLQQLFGWA